MQDQVIYVERKHESNGLATGALVCGIMGAALGLVPLFYAVAWGLGLTAIVLGFMGRRRAKREQLRTRMATWSIALGLVALGFGAIGYSVIASL